MTRKALLIFITAAFVLRGGSISDTPGDIEAYLRPYVQTNNFSGVVLVKRGTQLIFEKAYGLSDRERKIANSTSTQFHIASVSMQFTAAAVLKLVDQGAIQLDASVEKFAPDIPGAHKIRTLDLLDEQSGLPDINALPDYNDVLQHAQTPASLIVKISGHPLLFEPGSKFLHEEHSAYNLLALIVEQKTKGPFAAAIQRLVFAPLGLKDSFVDDDTRAPTDQQAPGYQPVGVYGLEPAASIHWSAKAGNASICATAADEAAWMDALFAGKALNTPSQNFALKTSPREGCGWFKGANKRFGQTAYYMNGRSPGFASFVLYLPNEQLTVVVFSNVYSSATSDISNDLASIVLGLPYQPFRPQRPAPNTSDLNRCAFQFGQDFYQANARLDLLVSGSESSVRWPGGALSPLIPLGADHFVDRAYWERVAIERNASGEPQALLYGQFRGALAK